LNQQLLCRFCRHHHNTFLKEYFLQGKTDTELDSYRSSDQFSEDCAEVELAFLSFFPLPIFFCCVQVTAMVKSHHAAENPGEAQKARQSEELVCVSPSSFVFHLASLFFPSWFRPR
jgi:hypothetical protein